MEERGKGSERWNGAITNLTEMASNLESLQKFLLKKAVFVDDETFAKASLTAEQARTIKQKCGIVLITLITEVFGLHMEELRAKQEEISKRDKDVKLLEAVIRTLGGKESHSTSE